MHPFRIDARDFGPTINPRLMTTLAGLCWRANISKRTVAKSFRARPARVLWHISSRPAPRYTQTAHAREPALRALNPPRCNFQNSTDTWPPRGTNLMQLGKNVIFTHPCTSLHRRSVKDNPELRTLLYNIHPATVKKIRGSPSIRVWPAEIPLRASLGA